MPEIEGIYYETEEDYYMILDELYKDGKEVINNENRNKTFKKCTSGYQRETTLCRYKSIS